MKSIIILVRFLSCEFHKRPSFPFIKLVVTSQSLAVAQFVTRGWNVSFQLVGRKREQTHVQFAKTNLYGTQLTRCSSRQFITCREVLRILGGGGVDTWTRCWWYRKPVVPDRLWGPPSHLYNGHGGGGLCPGHDAGHSPPSSAEVKEEQELHLLSPQTPSMAHSETTLPFLVVFLFLVVFIYSRFNS
jgi:hypothetical protein